MKILVTGATGFLGPILCAHLERQGHQVEKLGSKRCDLTQQDALRSFSDVRYDQIYHLAAWTQAGDFCLHHPGEQWLINQKMNTNVLNWWKEDQPQAKMICMGTSCAYDPNLPLVEDKYLDGVPIESLFAYAQTKRMLYSGLLALAKQFGLKYLCLIPSTLYGPGYHTGERQMHFIFDLIRKILRGKHFGEQVVLWGDGYQKRELVFVDDFVSVALCLNERVENNLVNIGAGEEFTIRQFAEAICQYVDYDPNLIVYDTSRYVGAKAKCLDVQKMKTIVPEFAPISLEDGLKKTIDWFVRSVAY